MMVVIRRECNPTLLMMIIPLHKENIIIISPSLRLR
jgi:hypothetical protein